MSRAPVPNPVPSFWTSSPFPLDSHRTTPSLPSTSSIVIIGGGLAGIATAYHLLKDHPSSPKPSVVLLEARTLCNGASGRNGGHVKPDTYFNVPKYTGLYGAEAAAELARFEASHVLAVKELVEREGLDCDFHLTRAVDVYLDAGHARRTEKAYRDLVKAGVVDLRDVAFVPEKDAERVSMPRLWDCIVTYTKQVSGVKGAKCCFSFTAAHLWPAKLVHQLAEKLIADGLNLQTNTPVSSISPTRDTDGKWTVVTPRGSIKTAKVICATNGYTAQVLPEYTGKIVPIRGICSRIASPKGVKTPHLVNTYGIRFDGRNNDYLIPRADGSVVVGGARQRFWHRRERWFDDVRDNELVEEAVSYFDGYMQRHFRGWEDSEAEVKEVWTGGESTFLHLVNQLLTDESVMGYSSDFMPHMGAVPGKPGQFVVAGFSGHGMPEILLSTKGVAAMVRDGVSFEESGLPRMFKTTKERLEEKRSLLEESMAPLWAGEEMAETKSKL